LPRGKRYPLRREIWVQSPGAGEVKRDGAAGLHLAVGRAGDMFFVLIWKNSPSGRMHVITMLKIVYDAFEK
jgi:hypothetical protein